MTSAFAPNNRGVILAALDDPDPDNPIATAIVARIQELTAALEEATAASGDLPDRIEIRAPTTALDEVVIELFRQSVAEADAPVEVLIVPRGTAS